MIGFVCVDNKIKTCICCHKNRKNRLCNGPAACHRSLMVVIELGLVVIELGFGVLLFMNRLVLAGVQCY